MKLEDGLIAADALTKRSGAAIIKNTGKIIAAITLIVATLFTFTDVALSSFSSEEFTATLAIMLIASYLMYFSLEDAGEKLGLESEEYSMAKTAYDSAKERILGNDIPALRDFCIRYTEEELKFRRRCMLFELGYSEDEYNAYLDGGETSTAARRAFQKVTALRAANLTPKALLSGEKRTEESELADKGKFKLLRMAVKLIPTAICTVVTVSVILTVKNGLTASDIIESILKLSSLPIIGCRGYVAGYGYIKSVEVPSLNTKKRIMEAFISERTA